MSRLTTDIFFSEHILDRIRSSQAEGERLIQYFDYIMMQMLHVGYSGVHLDVMLWHSNVFAWSDQRRAIQAEMAYIQQCIAWHRRGDDEAFYLANAGVAHPTQFRY